MVNEPLFLNEEQVRQHLRMADLIPAMEKALIDFSAGKVTQPVRRSSRWILGWIPRPDAGVNSEGLGLKAVTFYPSNAEREIPTHMATIFLVDPRTGTPLAIMDGRLITEMRTAAVSAAATKFRGARLKILDPFSEAGCRRAVTWKRCDSLGNSKKFVFGVRRRSTQSNSPKKLAQQRICRRGSTRRRCRGDSDKLENTGLNGSWLNPDLT